VLTIGKPIPTSSRSVQSVAGSVAGHVFVVLFIAGVLHHSHRFVAPYRLPGSEHGANFVLSYLPGRAPEQAEAASSKTQPKLTDPTTPLPVPKKKPETASANTHSPASANPDSTVGADALGSGNIAIALLKYFPTPKPDVSALPHGTKGDVILDVVIDTEGKVSEVTKVSGLGYGIDETVISTVQLWTYSPATQNGRPVASEQELHFHYERG
jgi:periplasmic protein TonB